MPKFECHHCTQHIDADDSLGGQSVACPNCGVTLTVPPTFAAPSLPNAIPASGQTSVNELRKMRNLAGVAAIVAVGVSAFCVVIPYAAAGPNGMALLTSAAWLGQTIGRVIVAVAAGAVVSATVAGIAYAMKKPFALNFYRVFIWAVIAVSILQFAAVRLERNAIERTAFERDMKYFKDSQAISDAMSRKAVADALSEMESATEKVFSTADASKPSPSPTKPKAELSDGVAEMQAISTVIQEVSEDVIRARKNYEQALDKAGLGTLLDSSRVATDADFTDTLAILMKVRSAAIENRRQAEKLMASFAERFDRFHFSASTKQRLLAGLDEGMKKSLPQMRESLDLEDKVVELFEKVIDHLMATKGRWKPAGGMFMFYEDRDLETFKGLVQQIQDCASRQEEIQKEAANQTAKKLEDMRDLLRKY